MAAIAEKPKKVKEHWSAKLREVNACGDAIRWCKTQPTARKAWKECTLPEWMLWILGETDQSAAGSPSRRKYVAFACVNARLVLPNFEKHFPDDKRPHDAIALCQRYADGENIAFDELKSAAASAWSAADSAKSAAVSAKRAAASAWRAAASAWSAADSAWSAADSAERAAASAGSATVSARNEIKRQCCDNIRREFPNPPTIK